MRAEQINLSLRNDKLSIQRALSSIPFKNNKTSMDEDKINPEKFLPGDLSYWHYPGYLTTPPLTESVLWHVLKEPIKISRKQVKSFSSDEK